MKLYPLDSNAYPGLHLISLAQDLPGFDPFISAWLYTGEKKFLIDVGKELLESLGYQVETRISAYDALEAFQVKPDKYDLIITDMTMPKMTGEKLAEKIKKIRPNIPILMCTGFSTMIAPGAIEEMGINSILMKPLTLNDLAKTVRRILDEYQDNNYPT